MKRFLIVILPFYIVSCINAELKREEESKYLLHLRPESNEPFLTALPGDNVKFRLRVEGEAPLKSLVFYGGSKLIDIPGIQNRTPPYQIDITAFTIDKDSPEETILCKVIGETNEGFYISSNVVIINVLDMIRPQLIKFTKDQSPVDIVYSDSPFSVIVEAQDLNSGISKIELFEENNIITTKYSESVSGKYVSKRYNFVTPLMSCGVITLVLRVYDNSSHKNVIEEKLILRINDRPFDLEAPTLSFISPSQDSFVSIDENIVIKIKAEDDCSLVDAIYYYTSYDEQVFSVDIKEKKRVVEEEIIFRVPAFLKDGESFKIYAWAEDSFENKHSSRDNPSMLRLIASSKDIPQIVVISPQDNTTVSAGEKVSVIGIAVSKKYQIKEVNLKIAGAYTDVRKLELNPPKATAQFNFEIDIPSTLKNGDQILIYIEAKDNSINETVGSIGPIRINIVEQTPVVEILSPSRDSMFYPLSVITTTIFAQSSTYAIKSIEYHIEGIEGVNISDTFNLSLPQKSVTKSFDYKLPDDIGEGELFISATALDTSNNQGKSEIIRVKVVDNIKPQVIVISPPYNSFINAGSEVELIVRAEDKNSLVAEINANIISPYNDSKKLLINKKSDEVTFTFTIPDTLVSNQVITFQIYAIDDSSLSNKSEVVQWRLRVR